jgi:hypothetical protein
MCITFYLQNYSTYLNKEVWYWMYTKCCRENLIFVRTAHLKKDSASHERLIVRRLDSSVT